MRWWLALVALGVLGCDDGGAGQEAVDAAVAADMGDAARPVDEGLRPDGSPPRDAAPPDAGETDAARPRDAAPPADARVVDAEVPADAAAADATPPVDAAPLEDAGVDAAVDAAPPEPDRSDEAFDPGHLMRVEIEVPPEEWERLRLEGRSFATIFQPGCLDQPFPDPFTWHEATVTIDGERFEGVGIRKKGFLGSLSDTRPSIKVHFEKFGAQARFRGLERMTFNNNRQDNSQMRQCVAYQAFAAAGVPAPRCSLAHVSVNGQSLGVYSHIESMKKAFVRRHFEDDEGPFFEGQFSDFRAGWLGTFAQKTNEDMPRPAAIEDLTAILQLPDDELFAALGARVDLANFYRFWTMEAVTSHWDGYSGNANNYYFYDDPTTGRVFFMPWGTDGTFQRSPFGGGAAASVQIAGLLNRRLYLHPEGGAIYVRALRESLAAFDEAALLARMDQIAALVRPALHAEQAGGFDRAVADLRTYLGAQRQRIEAEIANGPARVGGQLRAPFCQPQIGELDLRFDTTWGTYPGDPFAAGTGALVGTLNGMPIAGGPVGSQAGTEAAGADRGQAIVLGAITQGQNRLQVRVRIEPAVLGEAELAVDDNLVSVVLQQVAFGRTSNVGLGYRGTLTFEQQGDAPGAPVVGRLVVDLMRPR